MNKRKHSPAKKTAPANRVWIVEMKDSFGRWTPCAECQLKKRDCERVIRQYWKANNPDDSFRAKRYVG